ncbi:hypothetical protein JOD43_004471 [Pullulanibacillus pueri]|nr:hypothetical protein [Pullulanibacillus pueri]
MIDLLTSNPLGIEQTTFVPAYRRGSPKGLGVGGSNIESFWVCLFSKRQGFGVESSCVGKSDLGGFEEIPRCVIFKLQVEPSPIASVVVLT